MKVCIIGGGGLVGSSTAFALQCGGVASSICLIDANQDLAKGFLKFLFQKENYDPWIVASQGFNHPPLKNLADHPIWSQNPKLAMLPKEAEYAHERGWPAKPSAAVQLIQVNYVLPDMVAKAVNGMPTKRAMAWAEDQVKLAVQGKLKEAGA